MSITYKMVFTPTDGVNSADRMIQPDGTCPVTQVVGCAPAIPSGNYLTVMQSLVNNSVQPSTAQKNGLIAYMAAIQAATDTSSVETAIAAL
jgi:hypothetical protein